MLEMHNLQKVQNGKTVLDIPSFEVKDGQISGLLARTGSGADVLVSLLTGRSQPSTGTLRLAGLDPYADHSALSQILGVMFAEDTVYKNLGVLANLKFQSRLRDLPKRRAETVLAQVGLADQAHLQQLNSPQACSAGWCSGVPSSTSPNSCSCSSHSPAAMK